MDKVGVGSENRSDWTTITVTHERNSTGNGTLPSRDLQMFSLEHMVITLVVLGLMILATIIGNCFVIAAVLLEKNLKNVANYLVLSLAVADLMVASLVMPISAMNEISQVWFMSEELCDMWVSFDVLCCTSSILHLVAIAVDRYWAVTNIDYVRSRSAKRILIMIGLVWGIALFVSIPPLFGWKDESDSPDLTGACIISQDLVYTVFSTGCAFYLPLFVMLIIYARIFQVARSRIRKKGFQNPNLKIKKTSEPSSGVGRTEMTVVNGNTAVCNGGDETKADSAELKDNTDDSKCEMIPQKDKHKLSREKMESKRERKAARTLGIITGAFILCWVPFFVIALIGPFYPPNLIPNLVRSITLWLGYVNSLLNPIIYTIFSPDFRNAFRKILFGKYRKRQGKGWK